MSGKFKMSCFKFIQYNDNLTVIHNGINKMHKTLLYYQKHFVSEYLITCSRDLILP